MPDRICQTEQEAEGIIRCRNQRRLDYVIVDGPTGEIVVMSISAAIESDLAYRWVA